MLLECLILAATTAGSGLLISSACKSSSKTEPVVNNHYGDIHNDNKSIGGDYISGNNNSNKNSNCNNTDDHIDNRTNTTDTEEMLRELKTLLEQRDKDREIEEMLRRNEELIRKFK